jgi:hypothetical protein
MLTPLITGNQWFANKWQFYVKNRPKSKPSLRRLQPAQELGLPFRRPRRRRRPEGMCRPNFPERDFWPEITSGYPVNCPRCASTVWILWSC